MDNLLNNAVKYSHEKGIISLRSKQDENSIIVSIEDNGIGLASPDINNIFNEFYKADISRHDHTSSGLGLSICKRIIEMHNGKLWVESEGINKGSIFYFSIPKSKINPI